MLSVAVLAIAASAWLAYSKISALWLLIAPMVLVPTLAPQLLAGSIQALISSPLLSLGIIAVGLTALAALGARLWVLSEESPEYSWQIPCGNITARPANRDQRKLESQMVTRSRSMMRRLDFQFDLVVRAGKPMGRLRRLLFRQLVNGFSGLSMIPGIFVVMLIVFWLQSRSKYPIESGEIFFLAFFPQAMVLGMVSGVWLRRWPHLASESLWPLERRDLVRDLARSLAWDMAPAAVVHCVAIIASTKLFFSPRTDARSSSTLAHPDNRSVCFVLLPRVLARLHSQSPGDCLWSGWRQHAFGRPGDCCPSRGPRVLVAGKSGPGGQRDRLGRGTTLPTSVPALVLSRPGLSWTERGLRPDRGPRVPIPAPVDWIVRLHALSWAQPEILRGPHLRRKGSTA